MKWFDIIKNNRWVRSKIKMELKDCLEELEGVVVNDIKVGSKGHLKYYATYLGKHNFVVSTGLPHKKVQGNIACKGMRQNAIKVLRQRKVWKETF